LTGIKPQTVEIGSIVCGKEPRAARLPEGVDKLIFVSRRARLR
jgi:hypothetical protein